MSLKALRDAVIAELVAKLTTVPTVKEHGGRFNLAELQRIAAQTPSVWVGVLGVAEADQNPAGRYQVEAVLAAFLVTRSKAGSPRDAAALLLADSLLQIIPGNRWGLDFAQRPKAVRGENLYSGELDKSGVAIWAVTWRQEIDLGGLDEATLQDFKTFHADYDMAPPDQQIDATDDLTGLEL